MNFHFLILLAFTFGFIECVQVSVSTERLTSHLHAVGGLLVLQLKAVVTPQHFCVCHIAWLYPALASSRLLLRIIIIKNGHPADWFLVFDLKSPRINMESSF